MPAGKSQQIQLETGDILYSIHITNHIQNQLTLVPDYFIDQHLAKASGEFVKVYLYIQRHLKDDAPLTVPNIADSLYMTEAEVNRALYYWKSEGVLIFEEEAASPNQPRNTGMMPNALSQTRNPGAAMQTASGTGISTQPVKVPSKETLSPTVINSRMEEEGISHLAFMADTYLGKPLTQTELNTLFYFYDGLHFPVDLIEYLIEYCVSNNKKSMRYIETVALSWYEQGIDTREKAQEAMKIYNKNYYAVMKAFGISNRNPGPAEASFIKKWLEDYRFDLSVVLEACARTLSAISQPSFPYTDSILARWHKANVHTLQDVKALDNQFHNAKKVAPNTMANQQAAAARTAAPANRFHNFEQRDYNYQDLEQQFIRKVNGISQQ